MPAQSRPTRVLDPSERIAEVLFGLIMVLTFTGSLSIAEAGREDIRGMLIGAVGCNIAWGIIDGVFYLMGVLAERGSHLTTYRALRQAVDPREAHGLIAAALPPAIATVLQPEELEQVRQRLLQQDPPSAHARLHAADWRGACGVFLLVFCSTFPVSVPFMVMDDAMMAMRVSNAVAIAMLFTGGVLYGRLVGLTPWIVGISAVALGSLLVALTIALGG
jgi:hypothetical protein